MNYNDFLTVLMKLAVRVYPRARTVDDAFQRLLMDNILPLASRRRPDAVDMFIMNDDVNRLFDYYREALEQIFAFYATNDKRTTAAMMAANNASSSRTSNSSMLGYSGRSPGRATKSVNSMKGALGYQEFLKFASDFDLSNSVILSTIELGDIYLSSIKAVEPDSTIRKLTFLEFWETLVRCALVAYSKISDTTILDKIRGLFLYMWRSINKSVPRAFTDRRNVSTYAGDLLSGAMLFNKRFTAAWAQDNYRDYLSPDPRVLETGKTVLNRVAKQLQGTTMNGTSSFYRSASSNINSTPQQPSEGGENYSNNDGNNNYGYDDNTLTQDKSNTVIGSTTTGNSNGQYFGYGGGGNY